ncbi:hypothetical protein P152DRAFT_191480 [Eremomyces bilateralis CBS 781.70]|uniref:Ribosomal protein mS38 C-terminal domain-containing protein n=1 Tax=Eremomyces bilateralis CBS 781.70 TaxID=1392243 RepID=A0A6G1GC15_9PEZI|nr:uncharacterized protein P152DRAFT_191480 [Eremomyces bilateralis CBS 781.70]KAF1815627.1 hypothetical protein P152DRAFT_191480 [Eremomyces bilateralis CBS 781.70]
MFSPSLTRIVLRSTGCSSCTQAAPVTAVSRSSGQRGARTLSRPFHRAHQRRHSSSNASSCPPSQPSSPNSGRVGRKRSKSASQPSVDDAFSHLPSVPNTQHLQQSDIAIASFFSLHAPISIRSDPPTTIPSQRDIDAFLDQLSPSALQKRKADSIMSTLSNVVRTLDSKPQTGTPVNPFEPPSNHLRWQSAGTPDTSSIDAANQHIASLLPFQKPRAPAPITVTGTETFLDLQARPKGTRARKNAATVQRGRTAVVEEKQWETRVVIKTRTLADGTKEITGTASPMVRTDAAEGVRYEEPKKEEVAIRQRKLKMKKHKYKKLMKRTRNLRRKLGRL